MKTRFTTFTIALLLFLPAGAVEPQKPLLTLTVKRQVIDSDHDLRGRQGDSRQKTVTLRVEIANTTSSPVGESELSGDVLVTRARNESEKVVKEALGPIPIPAMKPGEKLSLDLGKIQLSELEWRNRKFEETLEEWRVVSTLAKTEIGESVSSDRYQTLSKEVVATPKNDRPVRPLRKALRRQIE